MVNEQLYLALKELLGVTDGNLASHLRSLEKVTTSPSANHFWITKPLTRYGATPLGKAFTKHIHAIENLLHSLTRNGDRELYKDTNFVTSHFIRQKFWKQI